MRHAARLAVVMAVLVIGLVGAAGAAKKARDTFWSRPDFKQLGVERIALFPVTSYDNNIENENMVEATLGQFFKSLSYRWISGSSTREILRGRTGSDSLLKALRAGIVTNVRLDSLQAPRLAAMLNCDAVLTLRVDQFDRHEIDWNLAGKPYTTVWMHGALVDSLGRLLWTVSGGETGEGEYYDPSANPVSVNDSGLNRKPVSGQAGAPTFREVLTVVFTRWAEQFPAPAARAKADSAATPR